MNNYDENRQNTQPPQEQYSQQQQYYPPQQQYYSPQQQYPPQQQYYPPQQQSYQPQAPQQAPVRRRNGIGNAGFVLSIIGLALCWVPVGGSILWFLGFLFSFIGLFKRPKGLAIAGMAISCVSIALFIILLMAGAVAGLFNFLDY